VCSTLGAAAQRRSCPLPPPRPAPPRPAPPPPRPAPPRPAPPRAQLAKDCWQQDPAKRPTMAQVLERIDGLIQQLEESEAAGDAAAAAPAPAPAPAPTAPAGQPAPGALPPGVASARHRVISLPPVEPAARPQGADGPAAPLARADSGLAGSGDRQRGKTAPGSTSSEGTWSMARGGGAGSGGQRPAAPPGVDEAAGAP
jgi:hypothetical protein